MVRISGPGLPSWPTLLLDQERRIAHIVCWHANWRSHERAIKATHAIVFVLLAVFAWNFFCWVPLREGFDRIVATFFAGCVFGSLLSYSLKQTVPPFLARRVFATKTEFHCSAEAVIVRSCFYARNVVIWRSWRDKRVQIRVTIFEDSEAEFFKEGLTPDQRTNRSHLLLPVQIGLVLGTQAKAIPTPSASVYRLPP